MQFKIVFNKSGDEIVYNSVNNEFLEFYVDWLNKNQLNNFSAPDNIGKKIKKSIEYLHNCIVEYKNTGIGKLSNIDFELKNHNEYLDQRLLNQYHARWANSHWKTISIESLRKQKNKTQIVETVCELLDDNTKWLPLNGVIQIIGMKKIHEDINIAIHDVENAINSSIVCESSNCQFDKNPFDSHILSHSTANLELTGKHLGRTLYNKFKFWDDKLEADDENTFNEISNSVRFNLNRSQTISASPEYIQWCEKNKKIPIGQNLNLGNIPNLAEKFLYYREVAYRNFLCNNSFKILI